MELNLIPWNGDTHFEVRWFKDGVNAFTGISFERCREKWAVRLNQEYLPAREVSETNPDIETRLFSTLTEGLEVVSYALLNPDSSVDKKFTLD